MLALLSRCAPIVLLSATLGSCQWPVPPALDDAGGTDASEIPIDAPGGVTVVVMPLDVAVAEGSQATFMVSLSGAPASMVSVALDPSDPAKLGVTPFQLFFGPSDWSTPQTVTVSGREDSDAENEDEAVMVGSVLGNATVDVTITDNDTVRIVASPSTGLDVNEGGSAALNVRLAAQPSSSVVVTVTSSDPTIVTATPTSLTFTAQNWNIDQSVSVTGASDADTANNAATVSLISSGLPTVGVPIQVIDDDVLGIAPSSTNLGALAEGGATSFTVTLTQQPSANVTVAVASSDVTVLTATPASLAFTTANWNVPQTVSVTALHDLDVEDDTATISLNASGLATRTVAGSVADDDTQAIVASPSPIGVDEGGTRGLSVRLAYQPTIPVTLTVTSQNSALATVTPMTLSFTTANYMTNQTVTVAGVEDVDAASASTAIRLESASDGLLSDVPVHVTDDDQLAMETSVPSVSLGEAGSAMFGVRLTAMPAGNVVVNISSADATAASVAPTTLTFSTTNWNTYQNVSVSGVADADLANELVTVNLTATALPPRTVDASITDDDMQVVLASTSTVSVNEGATATVGISLGFIPTGNVSVALSTSDSSVATVSPSTLTFTPATYAAPQNATVTGVNDVDTTDDTTTLSATSSGAMPATVNITVNDDDALGIETSATTVTIAENGSGMVGIRLTAQPASTTTVNIASGDPSAATVSTTSVSFTTSNWMAYQNVTLNGAGDDDAEDEIVTVSFTSTGLSPRTITVSVDDDDVQAVLVNPPSMALTEGGSGTLSVHLAYRPLSNATVTLMSGSPSVATVSVSTLTFTSANYMLDQTVTVTASQDADTSPGMTTVSATLAGATTGSVSIAVTDDDFIPTVPVLAKPMNGAYLGSAIAAGTRRPRFVWRPSTVEGANPIVYDLQYSTDPAFATGVTTVAGLNLTDHQPTSDLPTNTISAPKGTRFYWRVRACAGPACSAYSARRMVNVGRSDHDFNGDGYADLVIVTRGSATPNAKIFFGPSLSPGSAVKVLGGTPTSISIGDFNGDGFSDLGIGRSGDSTAGSGAGKATILLGGTTFDATPDFEVYGFAPDDRLGSEVEQGDFNGDGFDDFAVGAYQYDPAGSPDQGRVDVYLGAPALDTNADQTYLGSTNTQIGWTGSIGAADTNGDGYDDLVSGSTCFSCANVTNRIYFGASSGPASSAAPMNISTFEVGMSAVGDANGDGYGDLFALQSVYLGSQTGPSGSAVNLSYPSGYDGSNFGRGRGAVGDVNSDGYDDIAVGDYAAPGQLGGGGQFWLYFGSSDFNGSVDTPIYTGTGSAGSSLCGGADVNGDAMPDFADGAPAESAGSTTGRAHVFFGSPTINLVPDIIVANDQSTGIFGDQCSL